MSRRPWRGAKHSRYAAPSVNIAALRKSASYESVFSGVVPFRSRVNEFVTECLVPERSTSIYLKRWVESFVDYKNLLVGMPRCAWVKPGHVFPVDSVVVLRRLLRNVNKCVFNRAGCVSSDAIDWFLFLAL